MKFFKTLTLFLFFLPLTIIAQDVIVEINATKTLYTVSPYIYGKNNCFTDNNTTAASNSDITRYKDAGLRFVRENSGNNATKYNWRLKLSSHPDWYNNVYKHDWDTEAKFIQSNFPEIQTMYGFQLLGKVASSTQHNFGDWSYNNSQWWKGVEQNLAGDGVVNPNGGSKALTEGDSDLYLTDWPADSTTEILNHWFGNNGIGLKSENFKYWSMDNEPEIWAGTHDDVMPTQIAGSGLVDKYIEVAKKAREKYPDIKLCGPVPANEWQWYRYSDQDLKINGKYYCWLEYFIKRIADEEKASGVKLLDVLDIHWYPSESADAEVAQLYRVFYDEDFAYKGANGVKTVAGGWNNSLQKEYIFKRINDWLDLHFGEGHGITLGLSEFGSNSSNANTNAVLYASMLGTFANNGVEFCTPWTWKSGMWEVMNLFSNYTKSISIESVSSDETMLSAYSTINQSVDSMSVVVVNRNLNKSQEVKININNFSISDGSYSILQLSSLPANETFVSKSSNALKSGSAVASNNSITITVPAFSTTAILLSGLKTGVSTLNQNENSLKILNQQNAIKLELNNCNVPMSKVCIYSTTGKLLEQLVWNHKSNSALSIATDKLSAGVYIIQVSNALTIQTGKFLISK